MQTRPAQLRALLKEGGRSGVVPSATDCFTAKLIEQAGVPCGLRHRWARANPGQSLDLVERALALIPDSHLHVFEQAGHWPQWEEPEEPEEYDRVQIEFFKSIHK